MPSIIGWIKNGRKGKNLAYMPASYPSERVAYGNGTVKDAIDELNADIIMYKDITKMSTQYGVIDIYPSEIGGTFISGVSVDGNAVFGPLNIESAYRFYTINLSFPNLTIAGSASATIRVAYIPS